MNRLIAPLLLLAGLAYPFAVYYGQHHLAPRFFALLLGGLWLARFLAHGQRPGSRGMACAALAFCLVLGVVDSQAVLRWYPVLISLFGFVLFGLSLKFGPPMVERLARMREPELPEVAIAYTRQVTQVWVGFFLFNAVLISALTLWAPLSWWAWYTGVISYVLMGTLFAGEWLVRQRVRGHV